MIDHIPGPWTVGTETRGAEVCTIYRVPTQPTEDGKGQEYIYVHYPNCIDGDWQYATPEQKLVSAYLIAAAPEMLAALYRARKILDTNNYASALKVVDAAIAKAGGHHD